MTPERIKEIQEATAYPNSVSVQQALFKVWNECEQERSKRYSIPTVSIVVCPNCKTKDTEVICCSCAKGAVIGDFIKLY
jgi:hypothetical protein